MLYLLKYGMVINYQHPAKKEPISDTLYIRMMTKSQARPLVEDFIDKCFMDRKYICYVVHGKSGHILREMVHEILNDHPLVESFRSGQNYEGEMGATAIYLAHR